MLDRTISFRQMLEAFFEVNLFFLFLFKKKKNELWNMVFIRIFGYKSVVLSFVHIQILYSSQYSQMKETKYHDSFKYGTVYFHYLMLSYGIQILVRLY